MTEFGRAPETAPHSPTAVRRSDLAVALGVTAALFVGVAIAFAHARLDHHASMPVIDPGLGVPIAVRPVADLGQGTGVAEAGRPGAGGSKPTVPRAWQRRPAPPSQPLDPELPWSSPAPVPEPVPEPSPRARPLAPVSASPELDPTAEPQPPLEPDPEHADPQPLDADLDPEAPAEPDAPTDPEAPADADLDSDPGEAASELDGEGQGEGGPEGIGDGKGGPDPEGQGEGEGGGSGSGGDPLFDRAVAFYRARLVAWFSARFRVSGSGLSPAELGKHKVRVQIDIGEDLHIVDYRILSSDHPAFDSAARASLDKLRGVSLPAPPENYPGAVQRQLTVTFTCAEDSCD
jgi:hypothetical protein